MFFFDKYQLKVKLTQMPQKNSNKVTFAHTHTKGIEGKSIQVPHI